MVGWLVAAGCSDVLSPGLTVRLGRAGSHVSVRSDSIAVRLDSVQVVLGGAGADTARWTASHSGGGAVRLVDSAGAGGDWLRWTRDETVPPGVVPLLDTIRVRVAGTGGAQAMLVETLTVRLMPTRFVVARRPWRPGERDSVIASIVANRTLLLPFVGDVSDYAAGILPADSAAEIVPNPAFTPAATSPGMLFSTLATIPGAGWQIFGIKIRTVNNNEGGTTHTWLGFFFYNTADATWKGFVVAATGAAAVNKVVDTPSFDASGATSGAGGGELQLSSGTYWEATGTGSPNRLRVTASNFSGAVTTLTSGPFTGGTQQGGTMTGSLETVVMTRLIGSAGDAADTASVSVSNLAATFLECVFPSPCTTDALRAERLVRPTARGALAPGRDVGPAR